MKRNIYLSLTGIESLAVGIYLVAKRHMLQDDPHNLPVHVIHHMGDTGWGVALIIVGLIVTAVGLTNFNRWHAKSVMIIALSALWFAYFVAFLLQDIHFPGGGIQLSTVMTDFVFVQILVEARYGGAGQ